MITTIERIQETVNQARMEGKQPHGVALDGFAYHALAAELSCHLRTPDERVEHFRKMLETGELTLNLTGATLRVYRHEQEGLFRPIMLYNKG